MTKKSWFLVALGIATFLIFLVVSLPPSLVLDRLTPYGINASATSGSIWKGAATIDYRNVSVGRIVWNVSAPTLLSGRLRADVVLERPDGSAKSQVTAALSGRVHVRDLEASLPIAALNDGSLPKGLQGNVRLDFTEIVIEKGVPKAAEGKVEALNVVSSLPRPTSLGSFRVTFPPRAPSDQPLEGILQSLDGPAVVQGKLTLTSNEYIIDGTIVAGPNAPPDLVNTLQLLGPRDNQGRTEFQFRGPIGGG
jgi:hypothetical protein